MDLYTLVQKLWAQRVIFAQAPELFLLSVALVSGVFAWFLERHHSQEKANLRSSAALWKERAEAYANKLEGQTPEEVRARLDALEAAIKGRRLSKEQIDAIAKEAKHPGGDLVAIYINSLMGCGDGSRYASDLKRAFTAAGWRAEWYNLISGDARSSKSGLLVKIPNPETPSVGEEAILAGLRCANVVFDVSGGSPPHRVEWRERARCSSEVG
jgi:hypothetical protein